jgi:hypothetical protein
VDNGGLDGPPSVPMIPKRGMALVFPLGVSDNSDAPGTMWQRPGICVRPKVDVDDA